MKLRETVGLKTLQEITLGKKRPLSQTATHRQTRLVQKTGGKVWHPMHRPRRRTTRQEDLL